MSAGEYITVGHSVKMFGIGGHTHLRRAGS